ncbi:MAG: alpha/beta hydrolase family protein [Bacilli bacterium]
MSMIKNSYSKYILACVLIFSVLLTPNFANVNVVEAANKKVSVATITKNANTFVTKLKGKDYVGAHKLASSDLKKAVTPQYLGVLWVEIVRNSSFGTIGKGTLDKNVGAYYNVIFPIQVKYMKMNMVVRVNEFGQIHDFTFTLQPTGTSVVGEPKYKDSSKFTERKVVIGNGAFKLSGALTVPNGEGPFPVVVLVHGTGETDMDETAYSLKPFRDLAYGLSSKGVAVLRYNKRNFEHAIKSYTNEKYALNEETIYDALTAGAFLLKEPKIDPKRIYLGGHSLGGMTAPSILKKDTKNVYSGIINFAGPARSFPDVAIDQVNLLFKSGVIDEETSKQLSRGYEMLKSPTFSPAKPPKDYNIGLPYFYAALSKIQPVEVAKTIDEPILVLQGKRDYQVLAEKEIPLWEALQQEKKNVTIKQYDKLNHFFTEGTAEMSNIQEYYIPQNIPEYVINDVVEWISNQVVLSEN